MYLFIKKKQKLKFVYYKYKAAQINFPNQDEKRRQTRHTDRQAGGKIAITTIDPFRFTGRGLITVTVNKLHNVVL